MSKQPLVIADADAIVALSSKTDANHEKAKRILTYLATMQTSVLFPLTAICEAATAIQKILKNPEAANYLVKQVRAGQFPTHAVEQHTLMQAFTLFNPYGSKQNTLFDAVIATLTKELQADAIFSFDTWYKKQGLRLAEDLLPEEKQAA